MARRLLKTLLILLGAARCIASAEDARPNILWISCEDISPHLGCYGDPNAVTPNLDGLAAEGTRFTRAFSCHGVCAPSRTGIITCMSPIAIGANHMRSKVALPQHVTLFPQLLREAGYYCTNNSKTDYNVIWKQSDVWDESSASAHWKNRRSANQPFFAVFNLTMTHESKVWPNGWSDVVKELLPADRHDPAKLIVPPLYPQTDAVRGDFTRLADLITVMDRRVGELLAEIADAGLADNTVVFFWSDHGNGLPRAKRWTYESGTLVPFIVRVPDRLRAIADLGSPGTVDERMVSLIDLGPTVLSLAGIETPEHMHGRSLLSSEQRGGRSFIFGARDRLDERMDLVRTVRSERYRYVRNLMPWRPALQHVAYGEQNETLKEMRRLLAAGTLAPEHAQWFATPRRAEELYDVVADPSELNNLADLPEHQDLLNQMRTACDDWQLEVRDCHLIPEHILDEEERGATRADILSGDAGRLRTGRLLAAATRTSTLDPNAAARVADELSSDVAERWWQVTLIAEAPHAAARIDVLRRESAHEHVAIRIAAAGGLARAGEAQAAANVLRQALTDSSEHVRYAAMLQIDEAGADVIELLKPEIAAAGDSEYSNRLRQHALQSLP